MIPPLTVVTLWRPGWSEAQAKVMKWLQGEPWPSGTHFLWTAPAEEACHGDFSSEVAEFEDVHGYTFELLEVGGPAPDTWLEKHELVGALYTEIISQLRSPLALFVEDDNLPQSGAWKQLQARFLSLPADTAAVMGAYRSRARCDAICATQHKAYLTWDLTTSGDLLEAEWVGGGFTVYRVADIQKCLPVNPIKSSHHLEGWDRVLCTKLGTAKKKIFVDTSIHVAHLCPEVIQWCKNTSILLELL